MKLVRENATAGRAKAWNELKEILSRPKWIGPSPEPSDDELMELVVDEIHAMRREDQQNRAE